MGLTLPAASTARADHDYSSDCHSRLQAQKAKIDRDAAKYGERSAKVDHDVAKLEQERASPASTRPNGITTCSTSASTFIITNRRATSMKSSGTPQVLNEAEWLRQDRGVFS